MQLLFESSISYNYGIYSNIYVGLAQARPNYAHGILPWSRATSAYTSENQLTAVCLSWLYHYNPCFYTCFTPYDMFIHGQMHQGIPRSFLTETHDKTHMTIHASYRQIAVIYKHSIHKINSLIHNYGTCPRLKFNSISVYHV